MGEGDGKLKLKAAHSELHVYVRTTDILSLL